MIIHRTNLADKVTDWLLDSIKDGTFKTGEQLPSVEQLAENLSVGRSSVREALRGLQAKGVVSVIHGKGTFINPPKLGLGSSLFSFSDYMRKLGKEPSSVILKREVVIPDEQVRQCLGLTETQRANLLYRLRLADGEPLAIEMCYMSNQSFPDLLDHAWTIHTSLYTLLNTTYGIEFGYSRQKITSVLINETQSHLLQVPPNSPGLHVQETVFSSRDVAIEFTRILYRGDRYEYNLTLPIEVGAIAQA
jgi:GntR family transcriptional regulator